MNRKNLLVIATLAMAVVLIGCDQEETACTTPDDCAGYLCEIEPGATEGTCAATCGDNSANCAPGFVCGGDSATECVASTASCDDLDCDNYACDSAADPNACYTDCTADNAETNCAHDICEVADGADAGICADEVAADPFLYVAVVSRSDDPAGSNPGPDIDAINVSHGGDVTTADTVEGSNLGPEDPDSASTRTRPDAVLAEDVLVDGECDLDDWEVGRPDYLSLGGNGGYVIVSFGTVEIMDTDTIEVIELDPDYCNDPGMPTRDDAYEVYVGLSSVDRSNPGDWSTWCAIGGKGGAGGVFTSVFSAAACATM